MEIVLTKEHISLALALISLGLVLSNYIQERQANAVELAELGNLAVKLDALTANLQVLTSTVIPQTSTVKHNNSTTTDVTQTTTTTTALPT